MAATLGYSGFLLGPPVIGLIADMAGLRLALVLLPLAAAIVAWSSASCCAANRRGRARSKGEASRG